MRKSHVVFILWLLSVQAHAQTVAEFEDLNKTMSLFESAFLDGDERLLRSICSRAFERTTEFERMLERIGKLRVNSEVAGQAAEQVFELEPGPGELAVVFRLQGQEWVVESAEATGSRRVEQNRVGVLAREYYFSDFRRLVESGKAATVTGIRPNALQDTRLKGKKLVPRAETVVTVTDLVLLDADRVVDLIFVRLKRSEKVDQQSRGWLIEASGSMLELVRQKQSADVLLDFLSGNHARLRGSGSAFLFANAEASNEPALPVTHVSFRLEKILTSHFRWDAQSVQFLLSIDCTGASWAPPYKIAINGDQLVIDTQSDAGFVGSLPPHRYLSTHLSDGALSIGVKADIDKRPVATFARGTVKRHWTKQIEGGIRFIVELSADRWKSGE